MQQRSWVDAHAAVKMQFAMRATSAGRAWTGVDAQLYDSSGGFSEISPKTHHSVVMHVGAPIAALCRCDGIVQRRRAAPGDIDVIPTAVAAAWEEDGPTTQLSVHLAPSLVRIAAQDMGLDPDRVSVAPQLQLRDPRIEHIGWALRAELQGLEPQGHLYADSLGLALAARLLQRYAPLTPPRLGQFSKRRLRAVIDHIRGNLASDLSLAELAAVARLSISHFKALFKEATGVPVHQYVIERRVEYAVSLLSDGRSSLSEVASQAGFSDQSHMARCMRRIIGVTPAVVKRRHQ